MSGTKMIALQAHNGQYVCAEGGGGREVVANRNWIREWETFKLIDRGNNKVALQAHNGQYVCAEGGGGREVVANRNWIREWETFKLVIVRGGPSNNAEIQKSQSRVPSSMKPGETQRVTIRVKNSGNTTWRKSDMYRLGTHFSNQVDWSGFTCGGYRRSTADARAYLCHDVAPGRTHDFVFDILMPPGATGSRNLAVRMVQDGVEWFGESVSWILKVSDGALALSTGWENGEPHGFVNTIQYKRSVSGYLPTVPPECGRRKGEIQRSGSYSLMIAGKSEASYAYCYYNVFDVNIPVKQNTKLSYWIYHYEGTPQISVDGHFTDRKTIRDFKKDGRFLTDQKGVRIHPAARNDPMKRWHYVEVDLSLAAGKTLDFIMFAFDNGNNGYKGRYRAYVDDFKLETVSDGGPYDLVDYVLGDSSNMRVFAKQRDGSKPEEFAYLAGGIDSGLTRHFFIKNAAGTNWEEFGYDNNFLYRYRDTSWDKKCDDDGGDAIYALHDSDRNKFARWAPRYMSVGEVWRSPFQSFIEARYRDRKNCSSCPSRFAGQWVTQKQKLFAHHDIYTTVHGLQVPDVIELCDPDDQRIRFFYAKRYGLVGFQDSSDPDSQYDTGAYKIDEGGHTPPIRKLQCGQD
jgi:hypothetical protein